MMNLEERIAWVEDMGWYYEVFETKDDNLCLQAWDDEVRLAHEWEYTADGKRQIGEEDIYSF